MAAGQACLPATLPRENEHASNVIVAAVLVALGLSVGSKAADVSEQGARELKAQLGQVLSDDLANSGFITVKPATNRYEVTYDLSKFFDKISSSNFSIAGLKPLMMFAAPMDKGLWSIDGDNSLEISAHSKLGDAPETDITYSLASLVYTASSIRRSAICARWT